MNDYELDDFKNDEFGEFERYNNYARKYTAAQLIEMFTKSPSNLIWFDDDDDYDYDDDIPY